MSIRVFVFTVCSVVMLCQVWACGGPATQEEQHEKDVAQESTQREASAVDAGSERPVEGIAEKSPEDLAQESNQPESTAKEADSGSCLWRGDQTLRISEGGRLRLPRKQGDNVVRVEAKNLPKDWVLLSGPDEDVTIRVPYKSKGAYSLPVTLACASSSVSVKLSVDVQALRWSSIPTWTPGKNGPSRREHPRMWIDANNPDKLWLWGGLSFDPRYGTAVFDMWTLDLEKGKWQKITPANEAPRVTMSSIAPIPGEQALYSYGGRDEVKGGSSSRLYRLDYSGAKPKWSEDKDAAWDWGAAYLGHFFYDTTGQRYVAACGFQQTQRYLIHSRVATFAPVGLKGARWSKMQANLLTSPTGRYGAFLTVDPEAKRAILFSGAQQPTSKQDPVNAAQDLWSLDLSRSKLSWTLMTPGGTKPKGRRNGCSAFDPVGRRFFVFGGTDDQRTAQQGLWVLHLDTGRETWHRVDVASMPPVRSSCYGLYDAKRKQVLFGFGNSEFGIFTDLHRLQL